MTKHRLFLRRSYLWAALIIYGFAFSDHPVSSTVYALFIAVGMMKDLWQEGKMVRGTHATIRQGLLLPGILAGVVSLNVSFEILLLHRQVHWFILAAAVLLAGAGYLWDLKHPWYWEATTAKSAK
jgi:hypothetical protein